MALKLATPTTMLHGIILDFDTVVHNLVTVGEKVHPETILCTLERFINEELDAKDLEAVKALNQISANNPKSKVYGKITEIEVLYYGDIDNMHISLQKLVRKYDSARANRVDKYALDEAKSGKIHENIRVNGRKLLENQLAIKIYIDGEITMSTGDKLVVGNQLKSTVSRVDVNGIMSEDNTTIDAVFGYVSVAARIVLSPEISGVMNSVIKELSKQMGEKFKG